MWPQMVHQAGTYILNVMNENGCIAKDSLHVSLAPLPVVYAGNDTVICAGSVYSLMLNPV